MSKIYHRAKRMTAQGQVSPLCAKRPKAIDLSRESWTLLDTDTTCPKCLHLIQKKAQAAQ